MMIEVKNLNKSFGNKKIIDNFNFEFKKGNSYGIIGKSGRGKTTLINILAHIEGYDSGILNFDGKNYKEIQEIVFLRDYLGYVFQNFGLVEEESIDYNLNLGLINAKKNAKDSFKIKSEALKLVGLEDIDIKRKIYSLSGGEAQRVAIARIYLKKPKVIIADEPTAALDDENGIKIIELLKSINNQETILIIATHNKMVWELMDEIIELK